MAGWGRRDVRATAANRAAGERCAGDPAGVGGAKWGIAETVTIAVHIPHFAPPYLSCSFISAGGRKARFWQLTVEQCGVEWSAVE